MKTYTLKEAATITQKSLKTLQGRADRGTLRTVMRDGVRLVPAVELERSGLMPNAEVIALERRVDELEQQLGAARQLTASTERRAESEVEARERAEAAAIEAAAKAREADEQLRALAMAGWRERRRRLRDIKQTARGTNDE